MTQITATALVTFDTANAASSEHLSAQVDDRPTGHNGGKTAFTVDDDPAFLVWCSIPDALVIEAAGGATSLLQNGEITSHNQDIADHLATGEIQIEVSVSPPARGLPVLNWETTATGITLSAGKTLQDGSLSSVIFKRTKATPPEVLPGRWIVGNLTWSATASAYLINPNAGAKRVMLLASAKVEA